MIYLNVGNIWTDQFLDRIIELNKQHANDDIQVGSLFGSVSGVTPTARSADRIPYLAWSFIDKYVNKAFSNLIDIRYTLNPSCIGSLQDFKELWDAKLKTDVIELHNIGITTWTVTSPLLVELLRELFPADFIEVSTIAEVSTLNQAAEWKKLGANGVNLSIMVNRNIKLLKEISIIPAFVVSLLANEACLYDCPWRRECYNLSSHNSKRDEQLFCHYPFNRCNTRRLKEPWMWLTSKMILPQWLSTYENLTDIRWFKITGRTHPYEVIVPIVEAYMNKMFTGNLLDLWPSISNLGNTVEPASKTFIDCAKLGTDFLDKVFKANCGTRICGVTCHICEKTYKEYTKID